MKSFDQFHDGFLDGLLIEGTTVSLFLSTHDKQEFVLSVRGVMSLKADGFRQGNVIYEVLVRDGDDLALEDVVNLFEFKDESNARRKLEEVRRKSSITLEVNPSYGASCIILADSLELLPRPVSRMSYSGGWPGSRRSKSSGELGCPRSRF
jgi:hypothetical protein